MLRSHHYVKTMTDQKAVNNHLVRNAGTDTEMLSNLSKETFQYFIRYADPVTGLIADTTGQDAPSSIAVTGMGISCYICGIDSGFIERSDAIARILKILRFLIKSPQSDQPDATGYQGFYYHFLEMTTGKRVWNCEISTIDTAFLIAGILSAATYFSENTKAETEIRYLANELYKRVDWTWAQNGSATLTHGWTPENGFISFRWDQQYSEAILLYILALGSPTHPISPDGYRSWTATFELKKKYDIEYIYAGPLFIHQFSHLWIDFKGIQDDLNRKHGFDYFENSRRATHVHRKYATENPDQFHQYNEHFWGLSASDGPGDKQLTVDGKKRTFLGYESRGAPFGPDDGTVSPWSAVASLPFAPEIVLQTVRHFIEKFDLKHSRLYGFEASFNPTFPEKTFNIYGWVSPVRFGLNQGAIVLMIENYRSGLVWNIMRTNPAIREGLRQAGFTGGWLLAEKIAKS